ncbi:MAG TPA: hypothetical protein VGK33_20280, partial [Chloroflexota bacterium]
MGLLLAGARRAPRTSPSAGRARLAGTIVLALAVAATLLSGCAPSAQASAAQNKAKLDRELHTAQVTTGVPATLLQSVVAQEDVLAAGVANGMDKSGQAAAEGYAGLYAQVVALEKLTPDQIRQRATLDLQSLALALQQVRSQNISVTAFQTNFQQGQQQLGAATTAKDLFAADVYIMDQADAVSQIIPVNNEMQALNALVNAETKAMGSPA